MSAPRRPPVPARKGRRLPALLIVLGLALSALGALIPALPPADLSPGARALASGTPPGGSAAAVNLTVNLTDLPSFDPHSLNAPAGAVVHFTFANVGAYPHTFTLSDTPNVVLAANLTPARLAGFFAANGSFVNVSVAPATTEFVNFSVPSGVAGDSFEFVSLVAYQFQAGMYGFFNVSGAPTGPGITSSLSTTDTFRFVPSDLGVAPTGYPATIDVLVTNDGALPHTFTLDSASNNTLSPGSFTQYFAAHPPKVNVNIPASAGASAWANFTVSAPGIYEFICEVPGHFANGMYGFLYVGVAPPANATAPSTALVQAGVLLGAGSLLGVGVVLAAAAAYTGRFPRSPSPPTH